MTDLTQLSISVALDKLKSHEISAVELTQAYLERIELLLDGLGSCLRGDCSIFQFFYGCVPCGNISLYSTELIP